MIRELFIINNNKRKKARVKKRERRKEGGEKGGKEKYGVDVTKVRIMYPVLSIKRNF